MEARLCSVMGKIGDPFYCLFVIAFFLFENENVFAKGDFMTGEVKYVENICTKRIL